MTAREFFDGMTIAQAYQLPYYPRDIEDNPCHPLFRRWQWDRDFMASVGWTWAEFYGKIVELRTGFNPNNI